MIKIGITGQAGFIGYHLNNFFRLKKNEMIIIPFNNNFFTVPSLLENFVRQCNVIIHLAAIDRHIDPQIVYNTNIQLVKQLISAMDKTKSIPHVIFASSLQEERDNMFGKSKRECREVLATWAENNKTIFTGLVIPNVFGPFGRPFHNSVIATFCHQVTHNEQPKIEIDAQLKLIYIDELVEIFHNVINDPLFVSKFKVPHTAEKKVTEILGLINRFKYDYFDNNMFPILHNNFESNLFNTFTCYIDIRHHYPVKFIFKIDDKETFFQVIKTQLGGQATFYIIKSGITQVNHFNRNKIKRVIVIKGNAYVKLRRIETSDFLNFHLYGDEPSFVDIPIWYEYNITNIGMEDLFLILWTNEFINHNDSDTFCNDVTNHL
jgi:UDP-2-acetamido-2,6-beta-L-arabino-hexul-4-ose reductase